MIIVTGGAGFIGSCLVAKLNAMGLDNILVVDHLGTSEKWKNLRGKKFGDYVDRDDFLEALLDGDLGTSVETIFHLGACASTTETDAGYLMKNNYEYSKILAQWAMDSGTQFIYASSAATYGDGSLGYSDDDKVTPQLKPLNMYGYSKQAFDEWALRQGLMVRLTGFKFFNVFGPNEYHKGGMASLIAKVYPALAKGESLKLFRSYVPQFKDGEQKRDFIYVRDVVDVLWQAYKNPDLKGLYNLGSGEAHSWNQLGRAIFAALGKDPKIEYVDMPDNLQGQYQYHTQADMRKWSATAGEPAFTPLNEAVKDYVQNYLKEGNYL